MGPHSRLLAAQNWLRRNTWHHSQFADLEQLARLRESSGLSVSVCIPTLNEAGTIGKTVEVLSRALREDHRIIDELAVVDSGSDDETRGIAKNAGADVFLASEILPRLGERRGKGENLWKAIHRLRGDVICFVDADIENIHERFVAGLLGPLLVNPALQLVKALYDRPLAVRGKVYPTGGGRVTEILVRPLLALHFPELCAVVQPLSGEYAFRRSLIETLPFPVGYGVETANLIDTYLQHGIDVIGQCDLDVRVHRNRSNVELGETAFAILQGFYARIRLDCEREPGSERAPLHTAFMRFREMPGELTLESWPLPAEERPPMVTIPEYLETRRAS